MKKDKISIIIPAYNSEQTLKRCLDSILNQTYKNIEIIVINDGSKDKTLKILKQYEKKHSNVIIIDKKNEGQASARNDGFKKSTGEYVMFIDADDFIEKNYLEIMLQAITESDSDVCISGFKKFNKDYKFLEEVLCKNQFWPSIGVCVPWAKIFRSSFLKNNKLFFPNIRYAEDNIFAMLVLSNTNKITKVNNSGYGYYCNTSSLTHYTYRSFKVDVLPANQYLIENINKDYYKNNEKLVYYFLAKQSIYYMLTCGKLESSKKFITKNKEVMSWLKNNVPMFKTKPILPLFYSKNETRVFRFILFTYTFLCETGLIRLFAKVYCKNKIK